MVSRLLLLACLACVLAPVSAASPPPGPPNGLVNFDHSDEPLLNSRFATIVGHRVGENACIFEPPALELKPYQRAISMRQNSIDYSTCTSVIEIGFPILPLDTETDGGAQHRLESRRSGLVGFAIGRLCQLLLARELPLLELRVLRATANHACVG